MASNTDDDASGLQHGDETTLLPAAPDENVGYFYFSEAWSTVREERRMQLRRAADAEAQENMTFSPSINPRSAALAVARSAVPAHVRLHDDAARLRSSKRDLALAVHAAQMQPSPWNSNNGALLPALPHEIGFPLSSRSGVEAGAAGDLRNPAEQHSFSASNAGEDADAPSFSASSAGVIGAYPSKSRRSSIAALLSASSSSSRGLFRTGSSGSTAAAAAVVNGLPRRRSASVSGGRASSNGVSASERIFQAGELARLKREAAVQREWEQSRKLAFPSLNARSLAMAIAMPVATLEKLYKRTTTGGGGSATSGGGSSSGSAAGLASKFNLGGGGAPANALSSPVDDTRASGSSSSASPSTSRWAAGAAMLSPHHLSSSSVSSHRNSSSSSSHRRGAVGVGTHSSGSGGIDNDRDGSNDVAADVSPHSSSVASATRHVSRSPNGAARHSSSASSSSSSSNRSPSGAARYSGSASSVVGGRELLHEGSIAAGGLGSDAGVGNNPDATFSPRILRRSVVLAARRNPLGLSSGQRLYESALAQRTRLADLSVSLAKLAQKECTFSPALNVTSSTAAAVAVQSSSSSMSGAAGGEGASLLASGGKAESALAARVFTKFSANGTGSRGRRSASVDAELQTSTSSGRLSASVDTTSTSRGLYARAVAVREKHAARVAAARALAAQVEVAECSFAPKLIAVDPRPRSNRRSSLPTNFNLKHAASLSELADAQVEVEKPGPRPTSTLVDIVPGALAHAMRQARAMKIAADKAAAEAAVTAGHHPSWPSSSTSTSKEGSSSLISTLNEGGAPSPAAPVIASTSTSALLLSRGGGASINTGGGTRAVRVSGSTPTTQQQRLTADVMQQAAVASTPSPSAVAWPTPSETETTSTSDVPSYAAAMRDKLKLGTLHSPVEALEAVRHHVKSAAASLGVNVPFGVHNHQLQLGEQDHHQLQLGAAGSSAERLEVGQYSDGNESGGGDYMPTINGDYFASRISRSTTTTAAATAIAPSSINSSSSSGGMLSTTTTDAVSPSNSMYAMPSSNGTVAPLTQGPVSPSTSTSIHPPAVAMKPMSPQELDEAEFTTAADIRERLEQLKNLSRHRSPNGSSSSSSSSSALPHGDTNGAGRQLQREQHHRTTPVPYPRVVEAFNTKFNLGRAPFSPPARQAAPKLQLRSAADLFTTTTLLTASPTAHHQVEVGGGSVRAAGGGVNFRQMRRNKHAEHAVNPS